MRCHIKKNFLQSTVKNEFFMIRRIRDESLLHGKWFRCPKFVGKHKKELSIKLTIQIQYYVSVSRYFFQRVSQNYLNLNTFLKVSWTVLVCLFQVLLAPLLASLSPFHSVTKVEIRAVKNAELKSCATTASWCYNRKKVSKIVRFFLLCLSAKVTFEGSWDFEKYWKGKR